MLKFLVICTLLLDYTHSLVIRLAPGSPKEQLPVVTNAFIKIGTNLEFENICVHASNLNENEIYVVAHVKCKHGFEMWARGLGNDLKQACEKCASDAALLFTVRSAGLNLNNIFNTSLH